MDRWEAGAPTEDAFLALIREHGDKIYNFAFRLAGNRQDAADLVQEAFARAFENRARYDPTKPFQSWVYRILHNIYLDEVRRYAHKHTVSYDAPMGEEAGSWLDALPGGDPDPAQIALKGEADRLVQKALDSLPVEYKTAVALCDVEGFSYEQIAEVMACPVGTVRSRIHQGRLSLRKAFEKLHGEVKADGRT